MADLVQTWWVWAVFGFGLGVLEILAPSYIFLGFALGALATAVALWFGLTLSTGALMFLYAVMSLAAWLGLRRAFGAKDHQRRQIDHDINEN